MTELQTPAYVPVTKHTPATELSSDVILDVRDLTTYFFLRRGIVKAVDGVSFSLRRGEVLGLGWRVRLRQKPDRALGDAPVAEGRRQDRRG